MCFKNTFRQLILNLVFKKKLVCKQFGIPYCTHSLKAPCPYINPLTPNDHYSDRTASLTSKVAFYIFIQQIKVLNILNMVYTLRLFLFKMQFVSYLF